VSSSLHSVEEELPFSPSFSAELHSLFESHVGRPTPLMEARNLSQSLNNALGTTGVRIWLKREDLCTTGSHCANSAFGQALLARKLGFDRVIVPTGNGQMGVAAAAACASLNLSCEVHMAGSGISLQPANVPFIRARGASLLPAGGENGRLQHADDAAQTSSSQSSGKDAFLFARSCVGNPPYPRIVREFQKCIGREVYEQAHGAFGGAPDALFASVGGGSNALGLFDPFVGLSAVKLYGCTSGSKESYVVGLDSASGPDIAHLMGERMTLMSATDDEALEALINVRTHLFQSLLSVLHCHLWV